RNVFVERQLADDQLLRFGGFAFESHQNQRVERVDRRHQKRLAIPVPWHFADRPQLVVSPRILLVGFPREKEFGFHAVGELFGRGDLGDQKERQTEFLHHDRVFYGIVREARIDPTFESWQSAARGLLREGIPPAEVQWNDGSIVQSSLLSLTAPRATEPVTEYRVPARFIELAQRAAANRDPRRWAPLYRILWRIVR